MNKRVPDHNVHSSEKNPALEKLVHPKPMRTTCRCITESSLNSRIIGTNKYRIHRSIAQETELVDSGITADGQNSHRPFCVHFSKKMGFYPES